MAGQYSRWPVLSGGGGSGTVTSVGLSDGSTAPIFTISGSPVTNSGTLTLTLSIQSANTVLAGSSSGSAAEPTFRALVSADIPSPLLLSNGSVTAPTYSFSASASTGGYSPAADVFAITADGTAIAGFYSAGVSIGGSALVAPPGALLVDGGGVDALGAIFVLNNGTNPNTMWDFYINPNNGNMSIYNPYQNTQALSFNSAGGVGVGSQSPVFMLDVNAADSNTTLGNIVHDSPAIQVRNSDTTIGNFESFVFSNASETPVIVLSAVNQDQTSETPMAYLSILTANGAAATETLRITSTGIIQFAGAQYTTGAGTPLLGANCPAITTAAPNTWLEFRKADGTLCYVPAWV